MSSAGKTVARYDPCPCGSGKKYKFCCEERDRTREKSLLMLPLPLSPDLSEEVGRLIDAAAADDDVQLNGYVITGQPVAESGGGDAVPPELENGGKALHDLALDHPRKAIPRLESLVEQYPRVPALKNWLSVAYTKAGRDADADAVEERIWREHPNYLFGRISRARRFLEDGDFDRVPEALGGLDLGEMYPRRRVFHVSEALSLWALLAEWHYRQGEGAEAMELLDRMIEIDPDHATTQYTEDLLMPLTLREAVAAMFGRRPRKQVKSKAKGKAQAKSGRRKRPGASEGPEKHDSPDVGESALRPLPRNAR
jgi:tetratricopeptide (TPR) repeat protein